MNTINANTQKLAIPIQGLGSLKIKALEPPILKIVRVPHTKVPNVECSLPGGAVYLIPSLCWLFLEDYPGFSSSEETCTWKAAGWALGLFLTTGYYGCFLLTLGTGSLSSLLESLDW